MSKYTIFHNPKCSKSRQTLQILKDNECDTEIILYLETSLDQCFLESVIKKISLFNKCDNFFGSFFILLFVYSLNYSLVCF